MAFSDSKQQVLGSAEEIDARIAERLAGHDLKVHMLHPFLRYILIAGHVRYRACCHGSCSSEYVTSQLHKQECNQTAGNRAVSLFGMHARLPQISKLVDQFTK